MIFYFRHNVEEIETCSSKTLTKVKSVSWTPACSSEKVRKENKPWVRCYLR
jgi:hypothetical protein